jgi:hypothetical protein
MNKIPDKDYLGIKRLASKSSKSAIIQRLSSDFNMTPIIAEAYYQQIATYYDELSNMPPSGGMISYDAVASTEPPGKHIRLTKKVNVTLRLIDLNEDLEIYTNYSLAGLRRHRLLRITKEAYEQGALLSYEDIAMILTTSSSTIKRDISFLNKQGKMVVTRGRKLDIGPGLSHKTIIIDYYLKDYTFTEIEQITNHSEISVSRYLSDFIQISTLYNQQFEQNQIRVITQKSARLIREYIDLYKTYIRQNNSRLLKLLHPEPELEKKKSSSIKQGDK